MFTDLWKIKRELNLYNNQIETHKLLIIISLVTIIITISACSSGQGSDVLSFFFDGVDDEQNLDVQSDSSLVTKFDENKKKITPRKQSAVVYYHEAYSSKTCRDCHDNRGSYDLLEPQPALCYNCHDDFAEEFKFLHGPVSSGYCTECHNPHMSKNLMLLKRIGQDICLSCHEKSDVVKNEIHEDIEDMDCTDCHNPHGGEDRYLM